MIFATLCAAATALAPANASAQPADTPETSSADSVRVDTLATPRPLRAGSPGVADTITVLPPVRVEGERGVVPERTTATSVRLDRANVARFLPTSTADALISVPGVDLVKTGPWASRISLRGLSGDRVLLMVDGVRVNSVRGHGVQPSLVSLDRLDAVELLPGANSALFGSDALGGVVNLVTHRSLFETTPTAGLTVSGRAAGPGGAWSQTARARVLTSVGGFEVSGGLGGRDALVTPDGRIPNSGDREEDLAGRFAARLGGALIDVEHTHHAARNIGLPAFNNTAGASGEYPLQSRESDRLELTLPSRRGWPDARILGVIQTLRTDFTETTVDSLYNNRRNFIGTRQDVAADRVRTRAQSVQPTLRFGGFGQVRLVGELRHEEAEGPRVTDVTTRNRDGAVVSVSDSTSESVPPARRDVWGIGAFATETLESTRVEAGIRWDIARSRSEPADTTIARLDVTDRRFSAEGGLSRRFGFIEPYARVASGFRTPNLEERYYDNDIHGGLRVFGNPDLVAERSTSYEGGLRFGELAGGRVESARVTAYRSNVDDLITIRYIALVNGVPRFQYANVNRARIEGMEYAAVARAGRVRAALSVAFPRGFDLETGERLTDIGTARAVVDLSVPVDRWLPHGAIATRIRWNDAVWAGDPLLQRHAFTTWSLEASAVLAGIRAVVAGHNLLGARYVEPSSFIPEPGRVFAVSLRRDFSGPIAFLGGRQ